MDMKNSRYFHYVTKKNKTCNFIHEVIDTQGKECCNHHDIAKAFIDFFKGLMRSIHVVVSLVEAQISNGLLLSDHHKWVIMAPFVSDDVTKALFSMNDDKSLGLDGYSAGFYKYALEKIGINVCQAILSFFQNGKLLNQLSSMLATLITKKPYASLLNDFITITLSNIIYNLMAKVLANNKLQHVLPKISNVSQSAFIKGRSIT